MPPSAKAELVTVSRPDALGAGTAESPPSSPHPETMPTAATAATTAKLRRMSATLTAADAACYPRHGPVTANVVPGV